MKTARATATTAALVAALSGAALWSAAAASAHVTVAAPGVSAGDSDATVVFRVPTESATANTVEVRVQLPTATPLAGVLVAPIPGWTSTITTTKLPKPITTDDGTITEVVSQIDWKADSTAAIKPGYFGQFPIIIGQLPDTVTKLTFKAIQTYSDKKQVAWIEVPAAGSTAQPDHPAPVLDLTPATAGNSTTNSAAATATATATVSATPTMGMSGDKPTATSSSASKSAATTGIVLGAIGVLLGAAALALTVLRRRSQPIQPTGT